MKKLLVLLTMFVALCSGVCATKTFAYAEVSESECDRVFIQAVQELMPNMEQIVVSANKEILYDIELAPLGYLYIFETEEKGYAIVINSCGYYECTEIYFNAENPYKDYAGEKIYLTTFTYWVYENELFVDVDTALEISEDIVNLMYDKAYFATSNFVYSEEVINFNSRNEDKHELAVRVPQYYGNGTQGCVPIAGGNIIVYYTRFLPNLMPGFTPGSYLGSAYLYKVKTSEISDMVSTLNTYMGTSSDGGTTIPQFKNGMIAYCTGKGYNITYSSCMSNSSLNYSMAKQKLDDGQPLVIFVDPYTISTLSSNESSEKISMMSDSMAHAMASFGYREISYVLNNGQTRKDTYIQVSTGLNDRQTGYCKIDDGKTTFDEVYAINII